MGEVKDLITSRYRRRIKKYLNDLPDIRGDILWFLYFRSDHFETNLTHREIAKRIKIPVKEVRHWEKEGLDYIAQKTDGLDWKIEYNLEPIELKIIPSTTEHKPHEYQTTKEFVKAYDETPFPITEGLLDWLILHWQQDHPTLPDTLAFKIIDTAQCGDPLAEKCRQTIVLYNTKLVMKLSDNEWKQHYSSLALEDAISEGVCGLYRAIEKFDTTRGFKFSTYASHWVKQAVQRAILNDGIKRVPVHAGEIVYEYKETAKTMKNATHEHICNQMKINPQKMERYLHDCEQPISLNKLVDENLTLEDVLPHEMDVIDTLLARENINEVQEYLKQLPEREATIINLRYGLNGTPKKTLEEIGHIYGLTRERIRQLEVRGIKQLKSILQGSHPVNYTTVIDQDTA